MTNIIYVNFYSEKLLIDSIMSVLKQTINATFKIVVVNNGGPLLDLHRLFPTVEVIESSTNLGFGKANNLAAKSLEGEFVLFLNPDTILKSDIISEMENFYRLNYTNLSIGALGSSVYDNNGNENFSSNYFPSISKDLAYLGKSLWRKLFRKQLRTGCTEYLKVDAIIGCNLFMKRNVFLDLNGFDDSFFMYFEDVDLCYRLFKEKGLNSFVLKEAHLIHLEGGSSKIETKYVSYRTYKFYIDSLFYYIGKHSEGKLQHSARRIYFSIVISLNVLLQGLSFRRVFNFTTKEKKSLLSQIFCK